MHQKLTNQPINFQLDLHVVDHGFKRVYFVRVGEMINAHCTVYANESNSNSSQKHHQHRGISWIYVYFLWNIVVNNVNT